IHSAAWYFPRVNFLISLYIDSSVIRKVRMSLLEEIGRAESPRVVIILLAEVKPLPVRVTVSPTMEAFSIIGPDRGLFVTLIAIAISGLLEEPSVLETEREYSPSERMSGTRTSRVMPSVEVASTGLLSLK